MDAKKNLNSRRTKRSSKGAEENYWDCSVCTYRNTAEAFKCLMCDVRKGTSTRKPRINPQLVAQQVAQQYTPSQPKQKSLTPRSDKDKKSSGDKATKKIRPRLKNVDRSSAQQKAVTVNDVTVIITEFQPKRRGSSDNAANGPHSSSGNSTDSSQSDSGSRSETHNGDLQDRR
ncbi:YY1-associated factor 2 isoform X2 [Parasteatoda tepidariorum]|uniref:YY1-associated factor 2 isoform X2 n=1 Tax=Parasteatoda tepidariorum TaxID=114398 RepID=UPI00077FA59A|nr:YY1-associated factor 2 isoform X2 [Parasteatoda tepidariorum]